MNAENKKTTFRLDLKDDFISKNIQYYIAEKIIPVDSTKSYNKSNIKMVDNFAAHLFPQIEVKKHGPLIDEIEFTGIASTIKWCVSYPGLHEYNGRAFNSGFKTSTHESQDFEATGKLCDLGLGYFNDITIPIYRCGFEITFTRNNDNNAIFRWKRLKIDGTEDPSTLPVEGKVIISTFYLRLPIIEYSSEAKTNLINDLFKENYIFQFKKWQFIQHMKVTGKSLILISLIFI